MNKNQNSITLDDLYNKLDILIALIAIKDVSEDIEKVKILRDFNYSINDISKYLGLSSRTIDNYISKLKKQKKVK
jgi:hypothetical protein